jgi:hypothetical protein
VKTYDIVYDIVYDIIFHIVYDVVGAYDIVYDMQYNIVFNVVYDVVYDIVFDEHQPIYSCCRSAAAKRRRFKVSAPLRLDSATRDRRISWASFTVIFLGNALP